MIRSGDLYYYYPNCLAAADGTALTVFNLAAGSTDKILNSDATQADDYWNDALFEGISGTYLEGEWNHVKDFANTSGVVTLAQSLPGAPTTPGTFHLIHMGKDSAYRSSNVISGLISTDPVNVTGVVIDYVPFTNGTSTTGTIAFTYSTLMMTWAAPSDAAGEPVDVSSNGTYTLYSADTSKYIRITVTSSSLPTSDQSDNLTLSQPNGRVIPNTEAYQSETGIIRYIAVFFKNENVTDTMNEFRGWVDPRVSATTVTTSTLSTSEDILTVNDGSSFPANSYWILNENKDDCRYVRYRSGDDFYCAASVGLRGKLAQSWDVSDTVSCWTDVDITKATLSADALPPNLSTLTYSTPMDYDSGLDWVSIAPSTIGAVVMRETVLDVVYPIYSILTSLKFKWW